MSAGTCKVEENLSKLKEWLDNPNTDGCQEKGCKLFNLFIWCLNQYKNENRHDAKLSGVLSSVFDDRINVNLLYLFVWRKRKQYLINKEILQGLSKLTYKGKMQPLQNDITNTCSTVEKYNISTTDGKQRLPPFVSNFMLLPNIIHTCLLYLQDVIQFSGDITPMFTEINLCKYNQNLCRNLKHTSRQTLLKSLINYLKFTVSNEAYRPYISAFLGCCTNDDFVQMYAAPINDLDKIILQGNTLTSDQVQALTKQIQDWQKRLIEFEDNLKQWGGFLQNVAVEKQGEDYKKSKTSLSNLCGVQNSIQQILQKLPQPLSEETEASSVDMDFASKIQAALATIDGDVSEIVNFREDSTGAVRVYVNISAKPTENCNGKTNEVIDIGTNADKDAILERLNDSLISCTTNQPQPPKVAKAGKTRSDLPSRGKKGGSEKTDNQQYIVVANTAANTAANYFSSSQFSHVFSKKDTNETIVKDIKPLFLQALNGYSVVIFGYGYSGSGKTYTLSGKKEDTTRTPPEPRVKGILEIGLEQIEFANCTIEIYDVFELYNNDIKTNMTTWPDPKTNIKPANKAFLGGKCISRISLIRNKMVKPQDIVTILENIETERKKNDANNTPTIKITPNNKDSSRSHLFIVLKITNGDTIGYLTIVDMAGREDPIYILRKYAPNLNYEFGTLLMGTTVDPKEEMFNQSLKNNQDHKKDFIVKKDINHSLIESINAKKLFNHMISVIKEGFFINETINHLSWYFKKKNDINESVSSTIIPSQLGKINVKEYTDDNTTYNPKMYFYNPVESDDVQVGTIPTGSTIAEHINTICEKYPCPMIPILKVLESLGGDKSSKTKFAMMCCVRRDAQYANDIVKTLEFAKSISSANFSNVQPMESIQAVKTFAGYKPSSSSGGTLRLKRKKMKHERTKKHSK